MLHHWYLKWVFFLTTKVKKIEEMSKMFELLVAFYSGITKKQRSRQFDIPVLKLFDQLRPRATHVHLTEQLVHV